MRVGPFGATRGYLAGAVLASAVTFAALILLAASNFAIPLDFLVRPVAISLGLAVLVGLVTFPLGRYAALASVVLSVLLAIPGLWLWAAALVGIESAIAYAARRRLRPYGVGGFAMAAMTALAIVGAIRLAPLVSDYTASSESAAWSGPPVYLLLLDGYPRADTLAGLGIDNSEFVSALEERGFDHYAEATSAHQWTHRTLQALVAGSPDGIPDTPGGTEEKRRVRSELNLPAYEVIDPPAAHVVMRGGSNRSAGGVNDFEAELLGSSALGLFATELAADLIGESLRGHFEGSLELIGSSEASRVFAHLLAPHPPFLYAGGVSACWPACDIFEFSAESLGMSVEEWVARMRAHLHNVNERLLVTIDRVLAAHPAAVIVLFSDHGARYGHDAAERRRPFMAARTPGHPELFASAPNPHVIHRVVTEAYR